MKMTVCGEKPGAPEYCVHVDSASSQAFVDAVRDLQGPGGTANLWVDTGRFVTTSRQENGDFWIELWDGELHEKSGAFATLAQLETVLQLVLAGGPILDAIAKIALDWHSSGISALPLFPE